MKQQRSIRSQTWFVDTIAPQTEFRTFDEAYHAWNTLKQEREYRFAQVPTDRDIPDELGARYDVLYSMIKHMADQPCCGDTRRILKKIDALLWAHAEVDPNTDSAADVGSLLRSLRRDVEQFVPS